MNDKKSLYVRGDPNPDTLGFIPLRSSAGDAPEASRLEHVAKLLDIPVEFVDAEGYQREIIAAANHPSGYIAYVQCRAKELDSHVDIDFHIHLRSPNGLDQQWPIEAYNPYFGCSVRFFEWMDDTVVFIYREKHKTYVCAFGAGRPPAFKILADDWVIRERVLGYWSWQAERVSRLALPTLDELPPLSEKDARAEQVLPPKDW